MQTINFTPRDCPDCGNETGLVDLGEEPAREICGMFGCSWEGRTL